MFLIFSLFFLLIAVSCFFLLKYIFCRLLCEVLSGATEEELRKLLPGCKDISV